MGMMQQARLFADYAAYRGARAASLEMGECQPIINAELAALTPMLGRADTAANWKRTYEKAQAQQGGVLPHVINFWDIDPMPSSRSFDEPVTREADVSHVHLRMYYFYELSIPFVNWVIGRMYLAQYTGSASIAGKVDPLHPTSKATDLLPTVGARTGEAGEVERWAESYFGKTQYVVPLYASWSMRMFSRPSPGQNSVTSRNLCK